MYQATSIIPPDAMQSVDQLKTVWKRCVEDRRSGEVRDEPGLSIRWADNDFPFWNALVNTGAGADLKSTAQMLTRAADYMRSSSQTGFLWLFEDLLSKEARAVLPQAAADAGLSCAFAGTGMAGDILPLPASPQHPDLEFIRVRTEEAVAAYATLNCQAYGFPMQKVEAGFSNSELWKSEIFAYLGLKDGKPVTAGGAVAADGCVFVILIATASEHQRKGYGEAVTRKALYEAGKATGLRRATLHATTAGRPVYERIGLSNVATIGFYQV